MAFRGSIGGRAPGLRKSVAAIGRPPNFNRDRSPVLRPPRIKAIPTRDYAKAELSSENPMAFPGAGFGRTGLDDGAA